MVFPSIHLLSSLVYECATSCGRVCQQCVGYLCRLFLLLRLVWRLSMCLFVQHERRCRQLWLCLSRHKSQIGEISCFMMSFLR